MSGWSFEDLQNWAASAPFDVVVLKQVDSTSAWIKRQRPESPCMVIAFEQTGGYGQQGRRWHMRPGEDLTFTLWLLDSSHLAQQTMITPFVALKLHQMLAPFSQKPLFCKWPNDLYNPHGKLSGTLIERCGEGLLVGTGINWTLSSERQNAITADAGTWAFLDQWGQWALTELPEFNPQAWRAVMGQWADVDWFKRGEPVEDAEGRRYRYGGIQPDGSVLLWQARRAIQACQGALSLRRSTDQLS